MTFRSALIILSLLALPLFVWLFWRADETVTLDEYVRNTGRAGEVVVEDLRMRQNLPLTEESESFRVTDSGQSGVKISYADKDDEALLKLQEEESGITVDFPKDYSKPLEVKLDENRTINITDVSGNGGFSLAPLAGSIVSKETVLSEIFRSLDYRLRGNDSMDKGKENSIISYVSADKRKTLLYGYQTDQATGEKKLKHWTVYREGTGMEKESYKIENAKVRLNDKGEAEIFYFQDQAREKEQVGEEMDPGLLARAQRAIAKDMAEDLLSGNAVPDVIIPKPYFVDNRGERTDIQWKLNQESSTLSVSFIVDQSKYPIALDPTLQFTAPGTSRSVDVITGDSIDDYFSKDFAVGDFNSDGKTDLAVGAYRDSSYTGKVYIFYNDSDIPSVADSADHIIAGPGGLSNFGFSLVAGDFDADGTADIAVGANDYSTTGRTYVFFNDGSLPTAAADADVIITGEASGRFGYSLAVGDFNADNRVDLVAGDYANTSSTGRAYIFYNFYDETLPLSLDAVNADFTFSGQSSNSTFGWVVETGDFDASGSTDLAVGGYGYGTNTGRVYVFLNDGSLPAAAADADVILTGEGTSHRFASSIVAGDFNADGRMDLASGSEYSSDKGRAFVFYNFYDETFPLTVGAASADVIITGETNSSFFGLTLGKGDLNDDGKTDLVVGAYGYSTNTGRTYIFYNDGSYPSAAGSADVIITGETTSTYFGSSVASGDFNADGSTDLAVGARLYAGNSGRAYIFYSQNGLINTNEHVTGSATSSFGNSMVSGDFNYDGLIDLAVGAYQYSSFTGRIYIFYNDGEIPSSVDNANVTITGGSTNTFLGNKLAAGDMNNDGRTDLISGNAAGTVWIFYNDGSITDSADVTITGSSTNEFGVSLATGDFNHDGNVDLAVGERLYSTNTGRVYLFYNDGSIPTTSGTADLTITGVATSYFGYSLGSGDFNGDGRTDLAVGAPYYSSYTGRVYIFHNDGDGMSTSYSGADETLTGEASSSAFGHPSLVAGDFNADGKTDLAVSAYNYNSQQGRVYVFYNDGDMPDAASADATITGEGTGQYFGWGMTAGDFNADGRTDLAVGSYGYSTSTGRVYIFFNDGAYPTGAASADTIITGESTSTNFGVVMTTGDINYDRRPDLIVGATTYSSSAGRIYTYITEVVEAAMMKAHGSALFRGSVRVK